MGRSAVTWPTAAFLNFTEKDPLETSANFKLPTDAKRIVHFPDVHFFSQGLITARIPPAAARCCLSRNGPRASAGAGECTELA